MKNKIWKDLKSDYERSEFIECGRAFETGIIAKAIEKDLSEVYAFQAKVKEIIYSDLSDGEIVNLLHKVERL